MKTIVKNAKLENETVDIMIDKQYIAQISPQIRIEADKIIDADGMAIIPSFFNGHTHAAMTLFRGFADDLPLHDWLNNHIWPLESKLTEEYVYWGTKLACLEMIKSDTTFFNDMYWFPFGTAKAVEEMGIRALISEVYIDNDNPQLTKKAIANIKNFFKNKRHFNNLIEFALGPHAIYTVSESLLKWSKKFADNDNLLIHIHISETDKEVNDCLEKHNLRPIEYLDSIGFLGNNVILCHAIWLNDNEIRLCKKHNVKIIYNPVSNLKLSSGINFPYQKYTESGMEVIIGTDGTASNNNLDILESLKFAALLQKGINSTEVLPAKESFAMATTNSAEAFGINSGRIMEGMLADFLLLDLNKLELTPNHNLIANLIYSANGSCIDTVVCNGETIMQNRKVKDENEIIETASEMTYKLVTV